MRLIVLLLTLGVVTAAQACDVALLRQKLERAMEPLDHAYDYEDIDTGEMIAELERHVARLEALIRNPPAGCTEHSGGTALLTYAQRMRKQTLSVLADRPHP